MQITKVAGLVVLGIIAASPIEAISRKQVSNLENRIAALIAQGRKLITSATPENAVVSLQKIMQLKKEINANINQMAGWPDAVKRQKTFLEDALGSKHLKGVQKKIEDAKQAAQVAVAAAQAREDAETVRVEQEKQADAARRRAAAIMPKASAPAATGPEAQRIASQRARSKKPKKNLSGASQLAHRDTLLNRLQTVILPNVLTSFSVSNPVFPGDETIRLKRIAQIAPAELQLTVQQLSLQDALVPLRGEFSQEARNVLNDWVQEARDQYPGKESEYLQSVIRHIDTILSSQERFARNITEVEEIAARVLFLARLIQESKARITSLIDDLEPD
jgi:hypothetical protein